MAGLLIPAQRAISLSTSFSVSSSAPPRSIVWLVAASSVSARAKQRVTSSTKMGRNFGAVAGNRADERRLFHHVHHLSHKSISRPKDERRTQYAVRDAAAAHFFFTAPLR